MEEQEKSVNDCYDLLWEMIFGLGHTDPGNFFLHSIIRTAENVNKAFDVLVESGNYMCAAPLVRNLVDVCMAEFAFDLSSDPDKFFNHFASGGEINQCESSEPVLAYFGITKAMLLEKGIITKLDKNGKNNKHPFRLTDRFLYEVLDLFYPGLKAIYKKCSNYVHMTNNQLRSCIFTEEIGVVKIKLLEECVPLDYPIEDIKADMFFANKVLIDRLYQFYEFKRKEIENLGEPISTEEIGLDALSETQKKTIEIFARQPIDWTKFE